MEELSEIVLGDLRREANGLRERYQSNPDAVENLMTDEQVAKSLKDCVLEHVDCSIQWTAMKPTWIPKQGGSWVIFGDLGDDVGVTLDDQNNGYDWCDLRNVPDAGVIWIFRYNAGRRVDQLIFSKVDENKWEMTHRV